ncbi:MAG TPA: 16S rRNA (guanine(527)-N(7))-methyltransferase RsmG [Dissulfurispiraceae bacterium]|nr:16S rRNA (guanine(527)-N(7))-methyltransferase RsmG [Dissulfurispiraceae bacterium]
METEQELLIQGLSELGVKSQAEAVVRFLSYLIELKKWNRAYNLTAIQDDRDIIIKHFFDSLLFLRVFPQNHGNICDVGSGAGFPGIPIAIVRPDISIALIEPSRKKCAFLRNIKRVINLNNVAVLETRVEDINNSDFDIAVTRALFSISDFVKKAKHVVKKNGCLIVSKGPKFQDELEKLPASAQVEHITVTLPSTLIQRHLIRVANY